MDANISTTVGWVGVALAILAFGTMNIPIKLKYVQVQHQTQTNLYDNSDL